MALTDRSKRPAPSINERFKRFALTVELEWIGDAPEANSLTWVGHYQEENHEWGSGVTCSSRMWGASPLPQSPQWAVALAGPPTSPAHIAARDDVLANLRVRVTVSKNTLHGVRAILLFDGKVDYVEDFNLIDDPTFIQFKPTDESEGRGSLPFASAAVINQFDSDEAPWFDVEIDVTGSASRLSLRHGWDESGDTELESATVLEYLEHYAVW